MYRKILLSGVAAAAVLGAGGTAFALTGSSSPTPGSSSSTSQHAKKSGDKKGHHGKRMLRHLAHGQFVTKGKDGKFVTHDLITGTVTSVSSSSITVQAADKTSETFGVDKDTTVRERTVGAKKSGDTSGDKKTGAKKGTDAKISDIAKGDHVIVVGTGTSKYVAQHIVEVKGSK